MNGAFLHLVINHIPVVGMPFSMVLLSAGIARKSEELTSAGFIAIAVVGLITIPVYKTGGPAAHIVRNLGIPRELIHAHAEAADDAFLAVEILSALALLGLWYLRKPGKFSNYMSLVVLMGSFGTSIWLGWVAHLGGLIRHPEITYSSPSQVPTFPMAPPPH